MYKQNLIFRAPVLSSSGYGSHSRDILYSLHKSNMFDIKIISCNWGVTPMTALEDSNEFHSWIKDNIIEDLKIIPDISIQIGVPDESMKIARWNCLITAGIETTIAPKDWIDGCNRMDLIIVPSKFSKDILLSTVYKSNNDNNEYRITKPIEVLFEGVNTDIYNNKYVNFNLNVEPDFCFLFVGHWLGGVLGEDRKNVSNLIKNFSLTFKGENVGLVLKTGIRYSVMEREYIIKLINDSIVGIETPPKIYLLFGELTDNEMNDLYNHPKIKTMISLTRGEGFGRPLLEFTMTGKPVIAPNWSGLVDFLPIDKSLLIGGTLTPVHPSATNKYILSESKWFTPNYDEAQKVMKLIVNEYNVFLSKSEELRKENMVSFSLSKMQIDLINILTPYLDKLPKIHEINLPL